MPMLDAYIPDSALSEEQERRLLRRCTDLLLKHEGLDPADERLRSIAWVFVHRPVVYVAGEPSSEPRYRFVCQVPEGQYDAERRAAITREMTEAVAQAEAGRWPDPEARVWVFTYEVPEGTWGVFGKVLGLADIAEFAVGPKGRAKGAKLIAERRRREARALLDTAGVQGLLPS
jgi:phenylpyruvate tautomerase PptA (4-oxalocrotonate tautomerase family)